MTQTEPQPVTRLTTAHLDADGVIAYRINGAGSFHSVHAVASQAMLGDWFTFRYVEGAISIPYLEFVSSNQALDVSNDPLAQSAAQWLKSKARRIETGVVWLNDYPCVPSRGARPLEAGWLSGIGQAQALLACLHWWKITNDEEWKSLALAAVGPCCTLTTQPHGIGRSLAKGGTWFEEYPGAVGGSPLATHLSCLYALQLVDRQLESIDAREAFERGLAGLRRNLHLYDLGDWSRDAVDDEVFLLLRLVPEAGAKMAIGTVKLQSADGRRIASLDAATSEACDDPVTRLAGTDWGAAGTIAGRTGRWLANRQQENHGRIPPGGTDQNTYLVFEGERDRRSETESGLVLHLDLFTEHEAALAIEFRDLREENLAIRHDATTVRLVNKGWQTHQVSISPQMAGRPVPRNLHRFHTEVLGAILGDASNDGLTEVFERWHRADLHDIPQSTQSSSAPRTLYTFVNDRCGLRCKMCDIGLENLGIDQMESASMKPYANPGGGVAKMPILKPSLALNMTERAKDMRPEILIRAIEDMGESARGCLLQLNGTEPLLYPEYPEVLRAAKRAGMQTGITTSGLTLPREARRLVEAGLDQLLLSIDGPPEIHDEVRGVPKLFHRIVEGVGAIDSVCAEMGRQRPEIVISFAVTLDNHRHVLAFLEAIRPMRPDRVIINHLNFVAPEVAIRHNATHPSYLIGPSSVPAWEDCLKMNFLELFRQIEIALRTSWTKVSMIPYCPTPTRLAWYYTKPHLPMSRARCAAPWASAQIRADGTVAVLARCFDLSLGDLREKTIGDIWEGTARRTFAEFVLKEPFLGPCLRCCGSL